MPLTLHNNKLLTALLMSLFLTTSAFAAIGTVTEQQGPNAKLVRNKDNLVAKKGSELEMQDRIETTNTKLNLTFQDDTKVAVTEQSKFVIDEFIYDPNANTGKLAMRVAMGTVRYASGGIAKNNRENVRLRTPTATISVRGTDFAMVVDEIGRSLVTLLPSCPDFGLIENKDDEGKCPVGEITVSTDAGLVVMNQAYQTTVVAGRFQKPSKPRVLTDKPTLSNLLIIAPPKEFPEGMATTEAEKEQVTFLDKDLLEYEDLIKDFLKEDLLANSALDQNKLENEFLDNFLMIGGDALGDALKERDGVLPTLPDYPWVKGYYNEEVIGLSSERPPHIFELTNQRDVNGTVTLTQDGVTANIQQNGGGDVTININQSQ